MEARNGKSLRRRTIRRDTTMKILIVTLLVCSAVRGDKAEEEKAEEKKEKKIKLESTREEAFLSDESAMDQIMAANQMEPGENGFKDGPPLMEIDIVKDEDTIAQIKELKEKMKKAKTNSERREAKVAARWPNGEVPYEFDPGFPREGKAVVRQAIEEYRTQTCITFRPRRRGESDYVKFQTGNGCHSKVGKARYGGMQDITMGTGCYTKATAIHEMMHSIGFFHEQSRRDRDNHIFIDFDNIVQDKKGNYDMYQEGEADTYGFPYDKGSVMQYSRWGGKFAIDSTKPIITSRSDPTEPLGNKNGFSAVDIQQIRWYYNCDGNRPQEPSEQEMPSCVYEEGKRTVSSYQLSFHSIANAEDCARKCWKAKHDPLTSSQNFVGAQYDVEWTGNKICSCSRSKTNYPPERFQGHDSSDRTRYSVCTFGAKKTPTPSPGRPRPSPPSPPPPRPSGGGTEPRPSGSGGPQVTFRGRKLHCYNSVAKTTVGASGQALDLSACVQLCHLMKRGARSGPLKRISGASWVEKHTGDECFCSIGKDWAASSSGQRGSTCFFTGRATAPPPGPPPQPTTIEVTCQEGYKTPGDIGLPDFKKKSTDPQGCARECYEAKMRGGYSNDVSKLVGSHHVTLNGRFHECRCTEDTQTFRESLFNKYDPAKKYTFCKFA